MSRQARPSVACEVGQVLAEHGFDGMARRRCWRGWRIWVARGGVGSFRVGWELDEARI